MKIKTWCLGLILFFYCWGAGAQADTIILKGAGATFPYPLYETWLNYYAEKFKVRLTYQAIGSSGGTQALLNREVDFCGSDAYISDAEMAQVPEPLLHMPTCLGAVVLFYNLPGNPSLKLTPQLVADIFTGKIRKWSDPRITAVNPHSKFPDLTITVVHRSDGSGTTFIFTNYLAKVNREWREKVGQGKTVNWPTGLGVETNNGIVTFVKKISGALGYTELNYAQTAQLPLASIQNKSRNFIKPDLQSVSVAAQVAFPADTRALIIDTTAPKGYPISGFSWLIFYKEQAYLQRSYYRAKTLVEFLWWTIHEGQKFNTKKNYGILPAPVIGKAETILKSMTFNGVPLLDIQ